MIKITSSSISGLVLVTTQTHFPTFLRTFFFSTDGCKIQADVARLPAFCAATFQSGDKTIPEVALNVTGFL